MDLGLGNLVDLKEQLLASALQNTTRYDAILQAIGGGVARAFEKHCNRKFGRVVDDQFTVAGDRQHIIVPRYPLEAVSKVEFRDTIDTAWQEFVGGVLNLNEKCGAIFLTNTLGYWFCMTRVTYTGGFWYDTAETRDTVQPAGSTKLPEDLKLAWFLQCRKVWEGIDKLGTKIAEVGSGASSVAEGVGALDLAPSVKQVLDTYVRFAIT